jgi:flagellar biosynthesis/type III secretory pathway protein FliH
MTMPSSDFVIHFPVPPRAIFIAGSGAAEPAYSQEQFDAACREARQRGAEEATELMERQMLDLRADVIALQSGTFSKLAAAHADLTAQFRSILPTLVTEAASRVLGATPISSDTVLGIVRELLQGVDQSSPELEVSLAPHDLELITGNEADFREKHPSITFRANAELKQGDCMVLSRFGTLDGRIATKLQVCKEALHAA